MPHRFWQTTLTSANLIISRAPLSPFPLSERPLLEDMFTHKAWTREGIILILFSQCFSPPPRGSYFLGEKVVAAGGWGPTRNLPPSLLLFECEYILPIPDRPFSLPSSLFPFMEAKIGGHVQKCRSPSRPDSDSFHFFCAHLLRTPTLVWLPSQSDNYPTFCDLRDLILSTLSASLFGHRDRRFKSTFWQLKQA